MLYRKLSLAIACACFSAVFGASRNSLRSRLPIADRLAVYHDHVAERECVLADSDEKHVGHQVPLFLD